MRPLPLLLGVLLLLTVFLDSVWTTLWVDGHGGPIVRRATEAIRLAIGKLAGSNHKAMSIAGPFVLVFSVALWSMMLWAAWVLIASAWPDALVDAHRHTRATLVDRIYYVGYSLSTMGNGDYSPQNTPIKLVTPLAAMSGMALMTLSVTYVLALLEAVVQKRSFASQVRALGRDTEEFLVNSWNGRSFGNIDLMLMSLTEQLNTVTEQHTAYPLLHFYHASDKRQAVAVNVAIFCEVVTVLSWGIPAELRPSPSMLTCARESIDDFLNTLKSAYVHTADEIPPRPERELLEQAGIPLVGIAEWDEAFRRRSDIRKLVLGFLREEHHEWPRPENAR